MSLIDDLRAVSENAVEQLAARFTDLPRPLLVAIGAGDMAVARLAELREVLTESLGDRVGPPSVDLPDVRSAVAGLPGKAQRVAADLPGKAQQVAADLPGKAQRVAADLPGRAQQVASEVAASIEHFAAEAPGRAQELIAQLPDKLAEVQIAAQSLSPDQVRETVDAYAHLAGMIFGSLADRGDRTWTKVRSAGLRTGVVVDSSDGPATAAARASAAAAARASAATARAAAAAVRATTEEPGANAEPDSAAPLKVAEPRSRARKPSAVKDPGASATTPKVTAAPAVAAKPAVTAAPAVAAKPTVTPDRTAGPATEPGPAAEPRRTARRTPRNSPHPVTTPDGDAEVTVAPADVVPKGARVKPATRRSAPKPPGRSAPGTSAGEPIGM